MKLEKRNDWGSIYYAEKGKGLTTYGIATSSLALKGLRAGRTVEVTWPDGEVEVLRVQRRPVIERVSDMGHESTVQTAELGFNVDQHGVVVWVPIEETEIEFVSETGTGTGIGKAGE